MPKGGARNRSGPAKDPKSGRSESLGIAFTTLPAEGRHGRTPGLNQFLPRPNARHRALWAELWKTPQAVAWERERWRWPVVADLVKYIERMDWDGAAAAYATAIRQLRDDLGLSAAGLKQNGWTIAPAVPEQEASDNQEQDARSRPRQRRLRAV